MYIYSIPPIDYWGNATVANEKMTQVILKEMPEEPRDGIVYKCMVPGDTELESVYICKADNNGSTYLFSNFDFVEFYKNNAWRIK